jgi:F0F1-type ATP synthase assembly protein I
VKYEERNIVYYLFYKNQLKMKQRKKLRIGHDGKVIIGIVLLSIAIVLVQVIIGIVVTLFYYY